MGPRRANAMIVAGRGRWAAPICTGPGGWYHPRAGAGRLPWETATVIRPLLLALGALALLSACNTVEGVGRDVSIAGDAVSDTARDVQRRF